VIGEPPSLGAVHDRETDPAEGDVATTFVGVPGAVAGAATSTAPEAP
jgi:hypothetical protein